MIADYSSLGFDLDDVEFCRHLTFEAIVDAVPTSAFYSDESRRTVVRFCFCKDDATLDGALARLGAFLK